MTLSVKLHSITSNALDNYEFVLVSSFDLSSAFDLVNLSIKRMKIISLPEDILELVGVWLDERFYFFSMNGNSSHLFDLLKGTLQGLVLVPVLNAILVSPMFDIEEVISFAYDVQSG